MEICILILLYYLSQNPNFNDNVQPIMNKLKDSQHMLSFLNELSNFAKTFCACPPPPPDKKEDCPKEKDCQKDEKNSQSPTAGIANEFIEQILEKCLQHNFK